LFDEFFSPNAKWFGATVFLADPPPTLVATNL